VPGPSKAGWRSERRADRQRVHGQSFVSSRAQLRALGLRARKRLSQAFLEDRTVVAAIVRAACLGPTTDVLEVGPGLGVMTRAVAHEARRVVAVEVDASLADALRADVPENVLVVNQDVLRFQPEQYFDAPFTVVANLPYHITSPALRHLLGSGPPFAQRLVVMLQAEVGKRIVAQPGVMSALAVVIQAQAHVAIVRRVSADAFYPRPKVDSAVVLLEPLPEAERAIGREKIAEFTTLVQAGFKQPRKTLANSLSDGLGVTRGEAVDRLASADLDSSLRPQALSVADWVRLFRTE
jgi:16S rRNA (adenine1518-N6/adenine1519-N6)-dimethyltransferase